MFLEGPLLGRGSQVRRVRSAHKRVSSAKNLASDKQQLFKQSYYTRSSSSSSCSSEWGRSTPVMVQPKNASPPPSYNSTVITKTSSNTTKSRPRPKTAKVNRLIVLFFKNYYTLLYRLCACLKFTFVQF